MSNSNKQVPADLEQFLPSFTSNPLDALYEETEIKTDLSMEDFLKLPLNPAYVKTYEELNLKLDDRIKIKSNDNINTQS